MIQISGGIWSNSKLVDITKIVDKWKANEITPDVAMNEIYKIIYKGTIFETDDNHG